MRKIVRDDDEDGPEHRVIWLGDFNRHHPLWDDERNTHLFTEKALDQAEELINLLSIYDMHMLLPASIPTLEATRTKNLTRPDNIFASEDLVDCLLTCNTAPELRPPCTDHFPIQTTFLLDVPRVTPRTYRNFRKVEWNEFRTNLALRLADLPDPTNPLTTREQFDAMLAVLMNVLTATIQETVPITKPPPFAKRWYSKELNNMRREVSRLGRRSYKLRNSKEHPIHGEYRKLRNQYGNQIRAAKKAHWDAWIEEANAKSIWTIGKFIRAGATDGSRSRIPPLRRPGDTQPAQDNSEKSGILYETFFPRPPPNLDLPNFEAEAYPPPKFAFAQVTDRQIEAAC